MRRCPSCGRDLADHDAELRFRYPDPILEVPPDELHRKGWGGHALLQVEGVGAFVRALFPVHLTGGIVKRYGVWLGVYPAALHRAWEVWETDEYVDLEFEGMLANRIPPWEDRTGPAWCRAIVEDPDALPTIVESADPDVQEILTTEWAHEAVLDAILR